MRHISRIHLVLAALLTVVVITAVVGAAIEYHKYTEQWRKEAVCVQGWVDRGFDRDDIHHSNGDCYYVPSGKGE